MVVYVCVYVYTYIVAMHFLFCMYAAVLIYVHLNSDIYACVCMYVCMYVRI